MVHTPYPRVNTLISLMVVQDFFHNTNNYKYRDFTMISQDLIRAELDSSSAGSESVVMDKNGKVVKQ